MTLPDGVSLDQIEPGIRNGVRAVVVRDGRVLLQRKESPLYGTRYVLPGGSQELGETLEESLQRECFEEIGTRVGLTDLFHIADFYKPRNTTPETYRHAVELLFACTVPDDYVAANGPRPDKSQVAVEWVALDALAEAPLHPPGLVSVLQGWGDGLTTYLGVIA